MSTCRNQHIKADKLIISAGIIAAGVGQTGKTVTGIIRRRNDGRFFDATPGWSATIATVALTEPDAANMPGYYEYEAAVANVDPALATDGYEVTISESTTSLLEFIDISVTREVGALWEVLTSAHTTVGSFGVMVKDNDTHVRHGLLMNHNGVTVLTATALHAGGTKFYLGGGTDPGVAVSANWNERLGVLHQGGAPSVEVIPVLLGGIADDGTEYIAIRDVFGNAIGGGGLAAGDELIVLNTTGNTYTAEGVWKTPLWKYLTTTNVSQAEAELLIADDPAAGGDGDSVAQAVLALLNALVHPSTDGSGNATLQLQADAIGTTSKFYHLHDLPAAASSASYAGAFGVYIRRATGVRLSVKVTGIANDGNEHFLLVLAEDGTSPLPAATAVGDQLIITQLPESITVNEIMEHSMSAHSTTGTFGDHIRRILGLRQSNMRVVYTAWSTHNQPTEGYVLIYDSAADRGSDTGPGWALATGRYDFTATYNGSLQLTAYTSDRTS